MYPSSATYDVFQKTQKENKEKLQKSKKKKITDFHANLTDINTLAHETIFVYNFYLLKNQRFLFFAEKPLYSEQLS